MEIWLQRSKWMGQKMHPFLGTLENHYVVLVKQFLSVFFTVYNCPNDFDVYLDEGQIEKQIYWDEPIFADNVKIAHVMASKLPG